PTATASRRASARARRRARRPSRGGSGAGATAASGASGCAAVSGSAAASGSGAASGSAAGASSSAGVATGGGSMRAAAQTSKMSGAADGSGGGGATGPPGGGTCSARRGDGGRPVAQGSAAPVPPRSHGGVVGDGSATAGCTSEGDLSVDGAEVAAGAREEARRRLGRALQGACHLPIGEPRHVAEQERGAALEGDGHERALHGVDAHRLGGVDVGGEGLA